MGIEFIKLGYKGARSYLNVPEKNAVITWLQQQKYWNLSELECQLIEQFDVFYQAHKSYYDLLKEARVSWQKAQRSQARKDPELVKKKTQLIREMLEDLMSEINEGKYVVYAIDEVHLLEGDLLTHLWGDSKERRRIPIINEKNRKTYYGALDLFHPELIVGESEKGVLRTQYAKLLVNIDQEPEFMKRLMTQLLNLPGVIVEDSRQPDETLIFSVKVA